MKDSRRRQRDGVRSGALCNHFADETFQFNPFREEESNSLVRVRLCRGARRSFKKPLLVASGSQLLVDPVSTVVLDEKLVHDLLS